MDITIIGLYGSMGSGKSSVTNALLSQNKGSAKALRFADPLYKMAKLAAGWRFKDSDRDAFDLFNLTVDVLGGPGVASFMDVSTIMYEKIPVLADRTLGDYVSNGTKPREFLQYLGTDIFREFDKDCWAKYLVHTMLLDIRRDLENWQFDRDNKERQFGATFNLVDQDTVPDELRVMPFQRIYVIDDMRFPNEFAELAKVGEKIKLGIAEDFNVITRLIKLDVSPEVAAQRCAQRDGVSIQRVLESMSHASEGSLDKFEFDAEVDATKPLPEVVDDVWSSVTGKPRTMKGSNIIDLGSLKKRTSE